MENGNDDSAKNSGAEEMTTGVNLLGTPPAISQWKSCGTFCNVLPAPRLSMKEPIQGYSNDCYFIAALSSIAWAANASLPTTPLSYSFRDPLLPSKTSITLSTQNLPVDTSGKLIYAGSVSGETWPSLYEKAFAKFKNIGITDGDPDHLKIGDLPEASGMSGLINILGWGYFQTWNATEIAYLTTSPTNSSNILPSGKTKYPMVAWTDLRPLPAGLFNKHTFSLLGVYQGYVVLRNPYANRNPAKVLPEPTSGVLTTGIWNPDGIAENKIDFSNTSDGIFALRADLFSQYFWKFGRVNNLNETPSLTINNFRP